MYIIQKEFHAKCCVILWHISDLNLPRRKANWNWKPIPSQLFCRTFHGNCCEIIPKDYWGARGLPCDFNL